MRRATLITVMLLAIGTSPSHSTKDASPAIRKAFLNLPLSFEKNQGQFAPQVKFLSRGNGYALFLTQTEAVLALNGSKDKSSSVIRMKFEGANPKAQVMGGGELPGKSNYFIGNDRSKWRSGISQYSKVKWTGIYQGVDLIFYGIQRNQPFETRPSAAPQGICRGQMEFDFVVAPGADPRKIRLKVEGADKLVLDEEGNLALQIEDDTVLLKKPISYQVVKGKNQSVEGRFALSDGQRVGFEVGAYDPAFPLVIDPMLVYSTYLGGGLEDNGRAIAVDGSGNAYVTGYTESAGYPVAGPYQASKTGTDADGFVSKLDPTGTVLLYSTYLGGSGWDAASGIAVGPDGSAYVVGGTHSTDFPTLNPFQGALTSNGDGIFVTKLNPAGNALAYSTYLGGNAMDYGEDIAVDASGCAYVTGSTNSGDFPVLNAYQAAGGGTSDAYVTKFSPAGNSLVYSTYLGGGSDDYSSGIALDPGGSAYIAGTTSSDDFPVLNPFQASIPGYSDNGFVTKLGPSGATLAYSTYLGGSDYDGISGIAVDASGCAYVTGSTNSTDFPLLNPIQAVNNGPATTAGDCFITKLESSGSSLVYSTFLGGHQEDGGLGIAVDASGFAYVTGATHSADFPTADPIQANNRSATLTLANAVVAKLNPPGTALVYSTYLGGSGAAAGLPAWGGDMGIDIAVGPDNDTYVTGLTMSDDFPTLHPFQAAYGGGLGDVFVSRISAVTPTPSFTPTPTAAVKWCETLFISDNFFNVPVRKKVTIRIWMCALGKMSLLIYNTAGERVRVLRARSFQASKYVETDWDGANDAGEPVAAGMYLIRFEGDYHADTRSLLVLR